jgi:large subunit ribosomal protein L13
MLKKALMSTTKTWIPKKGQITREWVLIDAKDKILGRLATRIARILQGKHKPTYTPFLLTGDYVVVVNARHLRLSSNKASKKSYDRYTGFPSGRKEMSFAELFKRDPAKVLEVAVKGMLPKTRLAKDMYRSLKVYADAEHRHASQNLKKIEV